MAFKTVWYSGLTPEDKDKFTAVLKSSTLLRQQFLLYLKGRWETIERKGFTEEDYNSVDWTHKQAFNNGRLAILKEVADLFDFEGDKEA